jgi:hypothetical protein
MTKEVLKESYLYILDAPKINGSKIGILKRSL